MTKQLRLAVPSRPNTISLGSDVCILDRLHFLPLVSYRIISSKYLALMKKPDLHEALPVYSLHSGSAMEWDHDSDLTTPSLYHSNDQELLIPMHGPPPLIGPSDKMVGGPSEDWGQRVF